MTRFTRSMAAALALGLASATAGIGTPAAADSGIPAGALPLDEVVRKLEAAGYTKIHDVEYDDGHYEADALSPAGAPVDLDIDPLSGKVTREDAD